MSLDIVWNYFASFSVFEFSIIAAINLLFFLYAFAYSFQREKGVKGHEIAASMSIYTILFAFICALIEMPPLLAGLLIVVVYTLLGWHYTKPRFRDWLENFVFLWIVLTIFALVGDYVRTIMNLISLFIFYVLSEKRVRDKKKESGESITKTSEKKK